MTYFMTPKVTVISVVGLTWFKTSKGQGVIRGRRDLLMTPKGHGVIRRRRDLLHNPRGHGDLCCQFDLVYDLKRPPSH